jgi:hypothetical protein
MRIRILPRRPNGPAAQALSEELIVDPRVQVDVDIGMKDEKRVRPVRTEEHPPL